MSTIVPLSSLDRLRGALAAFVRSTSPGQTFFGIYEYIVAKDNGGTLDITPSDASIGLPPMTQVIMRPSINGITSTLKVGTTVLIQFVNGSPSRPVVAFGDPANYPLSISLGTSGQGQTEHVITAEACALMIYNTLAALMVAAGGGPLTALILQPLISAAVLTAITTAGAPAPPGAIAQAALALSQASLFVAGTPAQTSAPFTAAIQTALAAKIADAAGAFPSVGCPSVKSG